MEVSAPIHALFSVLIIIPILSIEISSALINNSQNVLIFSPETQNNENKHTFVQYENTIFTGNPAEIRKVQFNSSRSHPVVREHCLEYCLTMQTCDAIFVAHKTGSKSNELKWCRLYKIGKTEINLISLTKDIPELTLEPWKSLWPGGSKLPKTSHLLLIGK